MPIITKKGLYGIREALHFKNQTPKHRSDAISRKFSSPETHTAKLRPTHNQKRLSEPKMLQTTFACKTFADF